jgi:two-component system, OmpR family, response regulator ArlR
VRILIAEDEVTIARALKVMLEKNKYAVDMVHNGNDALDYIQATSYDALVLDIMMPGKDGIEVLKTVRAAGNTTPALFLTAKAEVADRVAGLDAGADDYLPKPFATSEFLARVRALVRRSNVYAPALLTVGNTTLDCDQYLLSAPADAVRLSNKEYQLTELFLRHPKQVFSSAHLFEKIWGLDSEAEMDVVWTYISFLRRKLKQIGSDVEIRTIRGAGYALEGPAC